METTSILNRNLLAAAATDPQLSAALAGVEPSGEVQFVTTPAGLPVPALHAGERLQPLHSAMDPEREGRRFHSLYRGTGYLVFLGLGGGYHIGPFLEDAAVSRLLVVEKDAAFVRAVLANIDLRHLLLDPRLRLLVGRPPRALEEFLLSDYIPAVYGDLKVVPLRASNQRHDRYYRETTDTIRQVIDRVADDYTVQAQFGKKWFVNTLANLEAAESSTTAVRPVHRAVVTGAGPSLEAQIGELSALRSQAFLIASDTSMPALLHHGINPDLVLSIDCQQISYHHFLQGFPQGVPLVLDLASPPVLTRLTGRTVFFSSGHPFSRYLSSNWRPFPFIDTSGGNVSHAAVSLAAHLGAREIHLFGLDFSYPEGKSYSRGTYIYPLFRSRELRTCPLEALFFSFILKNSSIIKEWIGPTLRYTTKPLIAYKERLEAMLGGIPARIVPHTAGGVLLNAPQEARAASPGNILAAGAARSDWRSFLRSYRRDLEALPAPRSPVGRYFLTLPPEQQYLWVTQFPAVAVLREELAARGHLLLAETRDWAIGTINRFLER